MSRDVHLHVFSSDRGTFSFSAFLIRSAALSSGREVPNFHIPRCDDFCADARRHRQDGRVPHRQALQTSAPTFLCRDQSKKALRGAESFSSWGIDRFADLRTHSFVQGPVKKSASGCRKFFLLGPPEFPCPLRLLAQFVHGEGVFRWPVVAPSSPNPGGGISILGVHF